MPSNRAASNATTTTKQKNPFSSSQQNTNTISKINNPPKFIPLSNLKVSLNKMGVNNVSNVMMGGKTANE